MPISGPSSFVPTLNEFIGHWTDVDLILAGAGPLVLQDGTTIAIFTGYRDQLQTFGSSIQGKLNDLQIADADVNQKGAALLGRLGEFNRKVRGSLGQSVFVGALPEIPSGTAAQGTVIQALDDMGTLWPKINAATIPGFTGPLLLPGAYAVATFTTELPPLKTAYATEKNAEQDVDLERKLRNAVQDKAYAAMRDYRKAVAGAFPENDPHVLNLPTLTPEAGSTPDAVTASGSFDVPLGQGKITWTPSADPNLFQYEVRRCSGVTFSTETEVVIGNISPTDPREFLTLSGLDSSGDIACFKVYVILTTGNEKGSNTVTITRP
jgi:hypothetical protein